MFTARLSKCLVLAILLATISQTLAQTPSPTPAKPTVPNGKPPGKPTATAPPKGKGSPAPSPPTGECSNTETTICVKSLADKINAPNSHTEAKPSKDRRTTCQGNKQKACCQKAILKEFLKKKVLNQPYHNFAVNRASLQTKPRQWKTKKPGKPPK